MSKNTFKVQMRRLAGAVLVFAFTIFLSGCSKKEIVGSLDMNQEYASIGDVSITNKELWNELKWSAHDYLSTVVEDGILSDYENEVKNVMADSTNENYNDYCDILKEYTVTSVLALSSKTTDIPASIKALSDNQIRQNVAKYVDNIYLKENDVLDANQIISAINELKENEESTALAFLYKYNYKDLAKYLLASHKLQLKIDEAAKDIDKDDEDDIGYFTKANYTDMFENNYVNQGDVEILNLRFMNSDEASDTLKAFGIKVYKNVWYYITSDESMTYDAYEKYYDDFDVSSTSNNDKCEKIDSTYGEPAILLLYISMYNYIYTYRDSLPTLDQSFVINESKDRRFETKAILDYVLKRENNGNPVTTETILNTLKETASYTKYIHYTAKDLNKLNSSLKSYVYKTLSLEDGDDYNAYSKSASMYGSYYYMVFKISHEKNEYDKLFDSDDTTAETYEKISKNEALYKELTDLVFKDNLTETYISTTLSDLVSNNIKVKIYDKSVEIAYAAENSSYSKNHSKAKSNNVIAKVVYTDLDDKKHNIYMTLTKDDTLDGVSYSAWDYLELNNGATTAVDTLSKKIIMKTDAFNEEISKEDYKEYENNLELMLASFANDSYSSSGYPASIGKYNFLMLYFHTANIKDIIKNYFHLSTVSQKLLTNYESATLLDFFKKYSDATYDNYFSLSGTQIQVYLDINEDGTPDDYSTWTNEIKAAAKELLDKIVNIVTASTETHATALSNVVEEYTSSSRFDNGLCDASDTEHYNPTSPECYWAKYRRLGLYVSSKDVSATNSTTSDVAFEVKARLLDIYKNIPSYILGDTFPSQYLDTNIEQSTINYDYETNGGYLVTSDGLNLLLVKSGELAASAKFESDDDKVGIYKNIPIIYNEKQLEPISDIYNESKKLNLNQIKVYLYEYLNDQGSDLIPSSIKTALDNFFKPVLTRYQANETQRVIILYVCYQLQNVDTIVFSGDKAETNQTRFSNILEINERVADSYIDYIGDITQTSNDYKDWWTQIKSIVPEIVGEGSQK